MQSIITIAGLAFANLAVAGPCKPLPQTTVSSVAIIPTTTAEPTLVTATVVPVPTSAESSTIISESETEHESSTLIESSTLATVVIQETTTAADTSAAETSAAETSAAETSATEAGTTTAEVETSGTATTTETALPTADQSCDNGGLDYAIYTHQFYNADAPHFSDFDPTYFHDATPTYKGVTERIGIQPETDWTKPFTIYEGSPEQMFQYKAVNHRGFLYAPETGIYEVTVPNSDEITLVWFGNKALSSWTRDNADLEQDYPGGTSKTFELELQAGTYTPFRLLWANAQGELNFIAEVKAPGGQVIVNGDGADNKYFVRYDCGRTTPTFPDF
ncbi:hypothetical protein QX201_007797 [Fusarium graminearum]|uniref:PA14 domain-containing protein n=1 Tax=Gibberella zeae TaxID=5518 RepID=A0A4E9ECC2_GIBZA|nr:hypothetical protein FG05_04739 [Fusarium graminearum]CAG1962336.1 unnamed protein product [Fusarium graminearum]CAG1981703.1 unnamed protein product [Fusarium graminearum]